MKIVITIIVMVGVGFCHHRERSCVGKCWNHMKPPPPPPPPPPYLRGLDQQARDEYSAIITNNAMTIAEKNQKIEKWAEKHRILDEVHRFNNHTERMKVEMKRNVARLIMELPQAMYKHSLIMENVHQTTLERHYAIQKLDAEDPQLYRVLKFIIKQFMPRHEENGGVATVAPYFPKNTNGIQGNLWLTKDGFKHLVGYT